MTHHLAFPAPEPSASRWISEQLRNETVGGALLAVGALVALVWANSPMGESYRAFFAMVIGPSSLHLDLSLAEWASDGLLTVFFLVVGLELKHELVVGSLSRPSQAVVPIAAAVGGMALPALLYLLANLGGDGQPGGWGIPMATDIAFALAVLAIAGPRLPFSLRAFLLISAIVDDIGAIIVIALFYSAGVSAPLLGAAVLLLAAYGFAQHRDWGLWVVLPVGLTVWALLHASGVHATVAGVLIGLLTRVRLRAGETEAPADRLQHRLHPWSAGVAVPLFALSAAGVPIVGITFDVDHPVFLGVALGLVVGKPLGVFGTAWLVARFTRAELSPDITWRDVLAASMLAGIGFTVALLVSTLAFEDAVSRDAARLAILLSTLLMAIGASILLRLRTRSHHP